jgi:hypothetical protein
MDVESAWRALRDDDAAVTAPPAVDDAVLAAWRSGRLRCGRATRVTPGVWAAVAAVAAVCVAVAVVEWRRPVTGAAQGGALRAIPVAASAPPVMTLAADPIFDNEPLEIVRVRMPRSALRGLGFALVEPEAAGLVDVDLLVGGDGLPRDIRRVSAVIDTEAKEPIQ